VSLARFSACASKFNSTRCRSAAGNTALTSSKLTLYRPANSARTLPAKSSACAPRGLAPARRNRFTSGTANGLSGCVASSSRMA
jgi:hypothetical protein